MSRVYFEEVQSIRETRWIIPLILILSLGSILPLVYGAYWQLIQGEPWGNKPMSDNGLLFMFLFVFSVSCFVAWLLLSIKLETKIDEEGIHYKFFPNRPTWQLIKKKDIISYEIKSYKNIFEAGGWGYRRNYFRRLKSIRIHGLMYIALQLGHGQRLFIGTQHAFEVERSMKRMMEPTETI